MTSASDPYLVDSSVWIDVLRGDAVLGTRLDQLVAADQAATTGLVRLEVLRGLRDDQVNEVSFMFATLRQLPFDEHVVDEAVRIGRRLRSAGRPAPGADLVIAAVAVLHDAVIVHRDEHYEVIAAHSALRTEPHL